MKMRAFLAAVAALLALTACSNTGGDTASPSQAPATSAQEAAPSSSSAPMLDNGINTLEPTTYDDFAVKVENGKVTCEPNVGKLELPLDGELKGFVGPMSVKRLPAFTRITWDTLGAHAVIVNDTKWAFVDGPGPNTGRKEPIAKGSNLALATWGPITKLVVCGWGIN